MSADADAAVHRPIAELSGEIAAGRLSPVELTRAMLERIERLDARFGSFVHICDTALDQARQAEGEIRAGALRGPLHGVPIAIKDNYLTADMPTTVGTRAPDIDFPRRDAHSVARLREAGAVLIGKTRMHEFAWGTVTPGSSNPWDPERVVGGSSGGSGAAVIAGFCAAALGSDTGGSIRIPASICGTVGLKPTFGLVSRDGVVPHTWSLDTAGPLTKSVADAALLLNVLAGHDTNDPGSRRRPAEDYGRMLGQPVTGMRLGVCRNHFFERTQAAVVDAVEQAIRDLAAAGMGVVDFAVPNLEYGLGAIYAVELPSATAFHDRWLADGRTVGYEPNVRALVEIGRFVTGADYLKAEQVRRLLMDDFRKVFQDVDVIAVPTTAITGWKHGAATLEIAGREESVLAASWRLTFPFNLTGLPAISLPCGFDADGMPIGLQLVGRPFAEATVLRVADAYERSHDWRARRPV
jgi:aspartyl-tRNA(Asn)/glutamyl-tRNA(Gln) amidotransferase subunit A